MQNGFYEVRVPDATDYWMEMVKCRHACPVHTDACGYVTSIAEGRYEDAYRIARAHNPFASICGRVCGAPCEAACRRGVRCGSIHWWRCGRVRCDPRGMPNPPPAPEESILATHQPDPNDI